ncbi:type VI secretion system protein IglI family protein [Piscirickettsia litoralis]|uniref:Uncharacterized protein n=1 Tax=Piscirickettsia litoralis TaxID=1891921 RepID=A0ABX3A127_9GAMM|nr:type VI secretion system protein IglI family protein [Piscirickettsia litoralis]ODN42566.1 hypothetical protein BGC07_06015 [Piscirickettsia litoralis]
MNELITKHIYDLDYDLALGLIQAEVVNEGGVSLQMLSYLTVCQYVVEGCISANIVKLNDYIQGEDFNNSKTKKNERSLNWIFETINDHIADNGLVLCEDIEPILDSLAEFKKCSPESFNIRAGVNRLVKTLNGEINRKLNTVNNEEKITDDKSETHDSHDGQYSVKSSKLELLFQRIKLCMELCNQERIFEAALFYKNIQEEVKNFDPISYFPEVFIPFYQNLSKSYVKIHGFIDKHQETLEWHIAEQMYKASPEGLVSGGEVFQSDALVAMNEITDFVREHKSILPNAGVIEAGGFSKLNSDMDDKLNSELNGNYNNKLDEKDNIDHDDINDNYENEDNHINDQEENCLNEIADEYDFDIEFDE